MFHTKKNAFFLLVDNFTFMLFCERQLYSYFWSFFFSWGSNLSWFNHTFDVFPSELTTSEITFDEPHKKYQKTWRIVKKWGRLSVKLSCRLLVFFCGFLVHVKDEWSEEAKVWASGSKLLAICSFLFGVWFNAIWYHFWGGSLEKRFKNVFLHYVNLKNASKTCFFIL